MKHVFNYIIKSKPPFGQNQFLYFHSLEIRHIFTLNDRSDYKLLPKHKTLVNGFSASTGAAGIVQAKALTLIALGAAAAFCFFSAEGKEKRIIRDLIFYFKIKISLNTTNLIFIIKFLFYCLHFNKFSINNFMAFVNFNKYIL